MLRTLKLSEAIVAQLGRVERARALYPNEDDGIEPLDREKVALADAVVRAVAEQTAARLQRLPVRARTVPVVVDVRLTPRRRQRGA